MLLAGPILRRADVSAVHLWMATNVAVRVRAIALAADPDALSSTDKALQPSPIGAGEAESIRLGTRLHLVLVKIEPLKGAFPSGRVLAYDIEVLIADTGKTMTLAEMCGPGGVAPIAYPPWKLPTFQVGPIRSPRLLHGSCRKPHGNGYEGLLAADVILRETTRGGDARPLALLLTGDQIYADDVAEPVFEVIASVALDLFDYREAAPGLNRSFADLACGERATLLQTQLNLFSSGPKEGRNQLMSFAEFAAAYLLAWNDHIWPDLWSDRAPQCSHVDPIEYDAQLRSLGRYLKALPAVRRVLANVPTYMNLDDHEITDDLYVTGNWKREVLANSVGRRVIANGLSAFWLFQAWGNDPANFGGGMGDLVTSLRDAQSRNLSGWETGVLNRNWTFATPTAPPVFLADCRTEREYGEGDALYRPSELMNRAALKALTTLISSQVDLSPDFPLVIVVPTPVFGVSLIEALQESFVPDAAAPDRLRTSKVELFEKDPESWHGNLAGMFHFIEAAISTGRREIVLLSGDVHYGTLYAAGVSARDGTTTRFLQFTSSALKNAVSTFQRRQTAIAARLSTRQRALFWWSLGASRRPALVPEEYIPDDKTHDYRLHVDSLLAKVVPNGIVRDSNLGSISFGGGSSVSCEFWLVKGNGPERHTTTVNLSSFDRR